MFSPAHHFPCPETESLPRGQVCARGCRGPCQGQLDGPFHTLRRVGRTRSSSNNRNNGKRQGISGQTRAKPAR